MDKTFWSHFKNLGRFLWNMTHSQQDWRKSSQTAKCTYNLQPDLLGSLPADTSPGITGHFGCAPRAKLKKKEFAEKQPKQLL